MVTREGSVLEKKRNVPGDHSLPTSVLALGTLALAVSWQPGQSVPNPASCEFA